MEKIPIIRKARELRRIADKLVYFQDEDEYSHIDKYKKVTYWIHRTSRKLILNIGITDKEEAEICLAVLIGYNVTIRNEKDIHKVLDRALAVLPKMSPSLLKCQLLVYCYAELYIKKLAEEAEKIMENWKEQNLSIEQKWIKEFLEDIEKSRLRWESLN